MLDNNANDEILPLIGKLVPTCGAWDFKWRFECVEEMGVGRGVWFWATIGVDKMERGKGPTCAQSRGFGKV
jgi:hypothetical protein